MAQESLYPEVDQIIAALKVGDRQDMVILIVPSHDKKEKELTDQDQWAEHAMLLFADLFGGATAYHTFQGIYRADNGKILRDRPIMIESYVQREDLLDEERLKLLVDFMRRMGKATKQASVAVVVNDVFHEVKEF